MKLHFVLDEHTLDDDAYCMIGWAKAASIRHDVTVHMPELRIWWELRCSIYSLRIEDLRDEYDGVAFVPHLSRPTPKAKAVVGCIAAFSEGAVMTNKGVTDEIYDGMACLRVSDAIIRHDHKNAEHVPWAMDFDIFVNDGNSWHKGRTPSVYSEGVERPDGGIRLADVPKRFEFLSLRLERDGDLVLAHEGPAFGALPIVTITKRFLSPNPCTIHSHRPLVNFVPPVVEFFCGHPEQLALRQRSARSWAFAMHSHRKVFDDIDRLLRKVEGR